MTAANLSDWFGLPWPVAVPAAGLFGAWMARALGRVNVGRVVAWSTLLTALAVVCLLAGSATGQMRGSATWLLAYGIPVLVSVTLVGLGLEHSTAATAHQDGELRLFLGLAAMLTVASSDDLLAIGLGLAAAGLVPVVMADDHLGRRARVQRSRDLLQVLGWSSLLFLGLALIYGATAATDLRGLLGRSLAVINRWGAAQPYYEALVEGPLSPAQTRHYRMEVVEGMAPAALLITGLLLVVAGLGAVVAGPPRRRTKWAYAPLRDALLRLVAFVALCRLVAVELATPLFVLPPYGLARALTGLGLLGVGASWWAMVRGRYFASPVSGWIALHSATALVLLSSGAQLEHFAVADADAEAWEKTSAMLAAMSVGLMAAANGVAMLLSTTDTRPARRGWGIAGHWMLAVALPLVSVIGVGLLHLAGVHAGVTTPVWITVVAQLAVGATAIKRRSTATLAG